MKTYNITRNIGRSKYVVSYYDGVKQHADGSPFFDIKIFSNTRKMAFFVLVLKKKGFTE